MATPYTQPIKDRLPITFKDLLLRAAWSEPGVALRVPGASLDTPLPETVSPLSVFEERRAELLEEKKELIRTPEADLAELLQQKEKEESIKIENEIRLQLELEAQYNSMLEQLEAWTPPTVDHAALKTRLRREITTSMQHDLAPTPAHHANRSSVDPIAWRNARIDSINAELDYFDACQHKEQLEVVKINQWLKDLHQSV